VTLPFTTSAALSHLGQVLSQGSVTIASEALTNLGTLLALLEVDIGRTTGVKRKAAHENESKQEKHPKIASALSETSPKVHPPPPPPEFRSSTPANTLPPRLRTPTPVETLPQEISAAFKTEPIDHPPPTPFTLPSSPFKEVFHCQNIFDPSEEILAASSPGVEGDLSAAPPTVFSPPLELKKSMPVKTEPFYSLSPTSSPPPSPPSREAFHCHEPTGPYEEGLSIPPLVISIPLKRLAPKTVQKINSFIQEKVITSPELPSKSSTICFFCGLTLPMDADEEHLQVCSARANVEVHMTNPMELVEEKEGDELRIDDQVLSLEGCAVQRKVYICEKIGCGKMYLKKNRLEDHQRSVHGAPKLKCEDSDCTAQFSGRESHRGHMWVQHGIGTGAKCEECGKRELYLGLLRKHIDTVHGGPRQAPNLEFKHKCTEPGCKAVFTNKHNRHRHMWTEHGIGAGAKCGECGKREQDISHLRNHLRAVHAAPKLRCEKPGCEATYTSDGSYRKHLKKHHP